MQHLAPIHGDHQRQPTSKPVCVHTHPRQAVVQKRAGWKCRLAFGVVGEDIRRNQHVTRYVFADERMDGPTTKHTHYQCQRNKTCLVTSTTTSRGYLVVCCNWLFVDNSSTSGFVMKKKRRFGNAVLTACCAVCIVCSSVILFATA